MSARKPADPHLELLRQLMRDDISLERAWHELNAAHVRGRAAQSTVEALMFSLRSGGLKALDEPDTQHRISELSEEQLHEVGGRLQALKIVRAWTAADIERLVETWVVCHA
jgi:transposase